MHRRLFRVSDKGNRGSETDKMAEIDSILNSCRLPDDVIQKIMHDVKEIEKEIKELQANSAHISVRNISFDVEEDEMLTTIEHSVELDLREQIADEHYSSARRELECELLRIAMNRESIRKLEQRHKDLCKVLSSMTPE